MTLLHAETGHVGIPTKYIYVIYVLKIFNTIWYYQVIADCRYK